MLGVTSGKSGEKGKHGGSVRSQKIEGNGQRDIDRWDETAESLSRGARGWSNAKEGQTDARDIERYVEQQMNVKN